MKVVVTGGAGFLGRRLVEAIAARGALAGPAGAATPVSEIVVFDRAAPEPAIADKRVRVVTGDIAAAAQVAAACAGAASIFHLAAVVSGEAEADFDLGLTVNVDGMRAVLEAARGLAAPPRLVYASSVAAFGGELPAVIDDTTPLNPQTSYGAQKVVGERLLTDYARKGFLDGRALRLPTIVVRGGKPNKAASGFASSIVREPLSGRDYVCPVRPDVRMWMLSPRRAVAAFLHAHEMDSAAWGVDRVVNLPGLSASMAEVVAAMGVIAGAAPAKRISWALDEAIQKMVDGWPNDFTTPRALAMDFERDEDVAAIIRAFIEDDLDS